MAPFHDRKQKTATKKQKKNNSQNTQTKQKQKTGKPKNKNRTPQLGMVYPKAAMRRNDKAACVPSPERVILETTAQGQNLTRWPGGAKQKSRGAETRDPPARIPEIASRSRAGMTSTDAHRSPRYAEPCEKRGSETKVKRKWDIQSEKETAATSTGLSESSHVFFGNHHLNAVAQSWSQSWKDSWVLSPEILP